MLILFLWIRNKLSQEQKLTLILWARKIDISQVAKNILQGVMVDGEGLIKPVQRWDKSIGKFSTISFKVSRVNSDIFNNFLQTNILTLTLRLVY